MDRLAHRLAAQLKVGEPGTPGLSLSASVPALAELLRTSHQHFLDEAQQGQLVSFAGEWLLDNYFLIEQALRQIKKDLPAEYYQELPKLEHPAAMAGYPRVLAIARALLRHEEYRVESERLVQFVSAFQEVRPLTMGELWALPIMLRYVLISSAARSAGRIAHLYDGLATLDNLLDLERATPSGSDRAINDQDIVAACVSSLRLIDAIDWNDFFERVSLVHQILAQDPAGVYLYMDFQTRNRYRLVIEKLARRQGCDEVDLGQSVLQLAQTALGESVARNNGEPEHLHAAPPYPGLRLDLPRTAHVGYYLIDAGRAVVEEQIAYRPTTGEQLNRWVLGHPTLVYLGSIGLLTALLLMGGQLIANAVGGSWPVALAVFCLTLIPALTIAVEMVQWALTNTLPPRVLPKLNFEEGIPATCRTVVVVPALISSQADVRALVAQLEQHYLRNPDPALAFVLLSDFSDAPQEEMPEDAALLKWAGRQIEELNARYAQRPFLFFHRRRLWNEQERAWMGWERKRGKLHEFNRFLRGQQTSFNATLGDLDTLAGAKYVITLDADSILPMGGGARLVGTLAHPLNQARFDTQTNKVIAGYTILQPRTTIKPTSANRSLFTKVYAGHTGLDLYTLAVSDVFQDLFGVGIYVGKGIYEIDAFERSLAGRVPENALLSHDLFEGIQGRVALVTDIVVYEDYPPHYLVNMMRSHRWVRGDWQLLPWLAPAIPFGGGRIKNDLAWIDRWKMVDNLRRSLLAPALLLLFVAGWTVLPGSPLLWTLLGLLTPALSLLETLIAALVNGLAAPADLSWRNVLRPVRNSAVRWLLMLAFLPHEALLALDAIARTLFRMVVSRRKLLEWTTAARAVRLFGSDVSSEIVFANMLPSFLLVAILTLFIGFVDPRSLPVAAPFLLVWLLASAIAYWISKPYSHQAEPLSDEQMRSLRALARQTWLFYEQFVGPEDNWLPPDHFQESPNGTVAHRTSPTNIGLYALSALAAQDLGYISVFDFVVRMQFLCDTVDRLECYRGHLLNWCDTRTLRPLTPRYVSTVDSGNLAACWLVLKHGCLELQSRPILRQESWLGLLDTLALLAQVIDRLAPHFEQTGKQFQHDLHALEARLRQVSDAPAQWLAVLSELSQTEQNDLAAGLAQTTETNATLFDAATLRMCRILMDRVQRQFAGMRSECDVVMPMARLIAEGPDHFTGASAPAATREIWNQLVALWTPNLRWQDLPARCTTAKDLLAQLCAGRDADRGGKDVSRRDPVQVWCDQFATALDQANKEAEALLNQLFALAGRLHEYVAQMEFGFLYHPQRHLFHIGYNLDTGATDNSYYDLLASEARIASLIAIAKQEVPVKHWLHLARPITELENGEEALLSWSGTMFEYLMPTLLLREEPGTLLAQSSHAAIDRQIAYAAEKQSPWGISESAYHAFDAALNYQYRAFGVPGLGIKRGLADDLVIAPYASLLALPLRPQAVLANLDHLTELGVRGSYGFYEAIDFTPSRLTVGGQPAVVRSFMAHHQGMIMLALANYLQEKKMIRRLDAEPIIRSVDLLLQEQLPAQAPVQTLQDELRGSERVVHPTEAVQPWRVPVDAPMPLAHYLANGQYELLLTAAGAGYSRFGNIALTRWRADASLDHWGAWLYVQDLDSGKVWSAGRQPVGGRPQHEEVIFHPHMAEFRRRDGDLTLHMEVIVAADDNVEIRRVTLTNDSDRTHHIGLSTYAEVSLTDPASDRRHPAFAKLFVESEYIADVNALLFRRRPRSAEETPVYLLHTVLRGNLPDPSAWGQSVYETDRNAFLGRNHDAANPAALAQGGWWEAGYVGRTGATLDPVMAFGKRVEIAPHSSVQIAAITLAASTRQAALELARRYRLWAAIDHAYTRARAQPDDDLRQGGVAAPDILERVQQLLSLLLYPNRAKRADAATLAANTRGQNGLWGYGISGDYPILLLRVFDDSDTELLQEVLLAHRYWRRRGLQIELLILNQQDSSYDQQFHDVIFRTIRRMESDAWIGRRGGIYVLAADQIPRPEQVLMQSVARVILDGRDGSLAQQLGDLYRQPAPLPLFTPVGEQETAAETTTPLARPTDLQFDNGTGGFSADGREYVIWLEPGASTPAPWSLVVAQPHFGFVATESGGGYTWAHNSSENRLTTWQNDPVADTPAEVIYLRDEETAAYWSATPHPVPSGQPYMVRYGAGYAVYEHACHRLHQELRLFVVPDAPLKIAQLKVTNQSARPRRITVTYYAEWVLGVERESTQQYIVCEHDERTGALLARNAYHPDYGSHVAFLAANRPTHGLTADRTEFLGRYGSVRKPSGLEHIGLTGRVEPGLDPCAALKIHLDLAPGASEEVCFLLGQGENREDALSHITTYMDPAAVAQAAHKVNELWESILGTVVVNTPDPALDLLLNRWLLYQTLACRLWGRSGYYQSSGAFGFRDQLQDVMALVHAAPAEARAQILRAARHQFVEGDVLHWWHPPSGRGVRTRMSDDLLWLPYVTAYYVRTTGDKGILQEEASFLHGEPLGPGEAEHYDQFWSTDEQFSLYEHCKRALARGLTAGQHGIPLMGAGDWNDGMNRVGIEGQGESIWLGWFLYTTLNDFAQVSEATGDPEAAQRYRQQAATIQAAVEEHGWDGDWYRRAYYDDGTPLGSAQNRECRIDSIAQSWAVLSRAAAPERAEKAMAALAEQLVKPEEGLILLFTPPFDKTPRDPGYIKGYVPGIRENGGQYTHAALWAIWAMAELGDGDRAAAWLRMINPIYHAQDAPSAARYKVEPYVAAADVYGVAPHVGRGGWTWYTGSAAWMYRLGLEAILGVRREGAALRFAPCLPRAWPGFSLTVRFGQATYTIEVARSGGNTSGAVTIALDGQTLSDALLPLEDDGKQHHVNVRID